MTNYTTDKIRSIQCSRDLLERLIVPQLVEKFLHFMEPESLLPCSEEPQLFPVLRQKDPVYILPSYFLRFIWPWSSHLPVRLPGGLFPSSIPIKSPVWISLFSLTFHMTSASSLVVPNPNNKCLVRIAYKSWSLSLGSVSCPLLLYFS